MNKVLNWKNATESAYGRMGILVAAHPWLWLIGAVIFTLSLATQLVNLKVDAALEGFLEPDAPALIRYNAFREQFGRDEVFIITVETADLFAPAFIENFRDFHQRLEMEVPYVDTVDSLINARHTYGEDDALIIDELLEEIPTDPAEFAILKDYTYNNQTFQNYLISPDRKLVALMLKLVPYVVEEDEFGEEVIKNLQDLQTSESVGAIHKLIDEYQGVLSHDIRLAGGPAIAVSVGEAITRDFGVFSGLAIVIVGVLLYLVFRRMSGVIMPIAVMFLAVTATISSMALFDVPMQMSTSILPSFLLAVCVGDSIHLLTIFYRHYDSGLTKDLALSSALEHTGLAMFFTSITTAAGLASFATSSLPPIANLGIFAAIGSLVAFIYTIFMLPCLIMLLPIKRRAIEEEKETLLSQLIDACVRLTTARPVIISVAGITLLILSIGIAFQLNFSHDALKWFPDDHPVKLAIKNAEKRLGGTLPIEIIIDTGKKGGATDPELLKKVDQSLKEINQWKTENFSIAKVISLIDVVKETNRALNQNDNKFYTIPDNQRLVRQELLLVEMDAADELFQLTDSDYQILRCTLLVPWVDGIHYTELIQEIDQYFASNYKEVASVNTTGLTVIVGATLVEMIYSTAKSYLLAGVIISVMMIVLLGSFSAGLVSMLPTILPIAMVLALMKMINIPLDMFTLLIGSIAIGLTVDDTVHFMHGFRRAYKSHGDAERAISETLHSTGRAMVVTSVVLSLGFLIYTQASLNNMRDFGVLTALCISLALVTVFLLAPALMILMTRLQNWFADKTSKTKSASNLPDAEFTPKAQVLADHMEPEGKVAEL